MIARIGGIVAPYVVLLVMFSLPFNKQCFRNVYSGGGGGGALPYKTLMGMCLYIGSHFHDWIDYNGVEFSIELLEWSRTFLDFWGKKNLLSIK